MPIKTPHYKLEAFRRGEAYSSAVDRRRFLTIDHQIALLTDIVGDGRLDGWGVSISDLSELEISVSPGMGLINRFTTRTFNNIIFNLTDNQTTFLFMRRKPGVIGGFSEYANMAGVVVADLTPPAIPTGFVFNSIGFNTVSFSWTENSEPDIGHYSILRSTNAIDYVEVGTSETNSFTDVSLLENTIYYYKLKAVDLSGNESSETSPEMVKTIKDLSKPVPPSGVGAVGGNGIIKMFWFPASTGNVKKYEAAIQPLDASLRPLGPSFSQSVLVTENQMVIPNLLNGNPYKIILYSVSKNNIYSEGVSKIVTPKFFRGPADIEEINVEFYPGDNDNFNVVMNVSWVPGFDPYISSVATKYQITIIENGIRTSDPIIVRNGLNREIRIIPFTSEENQSAFESVKPVTSYFVIVQSIDEIGRVSPGTPAFAKSPSFDLPPRVSDARAFVGDDNRISALWTNSTSPYFDYNEITVVSTDISSDIETTLYENENINKSSSFILDASLFEEGTSFEFSVVAVDIFGNESEENIFSVATISSEGFPRPVPPPNQSVFSENGSVTLKWSGLDESLIKQYRIWRAPFQLFTLPSIFEIVDTIPSSLNKYTDFDVDNGNSYMYFVTSIDIFGQETENPIEDGFVSHNLLTATPKQSGSMLPPEDLMVSQSGFNAILTWTPTGGAFDGYEVFFSEGNRYSFVKIGSASPSETSFTHTDALLKDSVTYYYLLRKIRNEADVFTTSSNVFPTGSILLAEIETDNGSISIDETPAIEIKNMEDPIREETQRQLASHRHFLESDGTDKRIDLSSDVSVKDWQTIDYQNYTTESDLEGSGGFIVLLDGDVNDSFFTDINGDKDLSSIEQLNNGVSPFLFDIDTTDGVLTFDTPLFSNEANSITPFTSPPTLTVVLLDIREVQGMLPASRIKGLSATQINSGLLNIPQVPKIQHDGRFNQRLIPLSENMDSDNRFTYEFVDSSISMQSTRTFYDIIKVEDNRILAATSQGIILSEDFGVTWSSPFITTTAPSKLFYASAFDKYFALTNDGVWVSTGKFSSWVKMPGLDNTGAIRDVAQDQSGNVYVSTDLGIYKLSVDIITKSLTWRQTPLFGPNSTETYAILYDSSQTRMIVSNELGILESTNQGASWTFSSEFEETEKIYELINSNGYIFALTNFAIWRKKNSEDSFVRLIEFDSDIARKLVIFGSKLYFTTEDGILSTTEDTNIYTDNSIKIKRILPEININDNIIPVTSLNVIDDLLFIGTDRRLFIRRLNDDLWIQSDFMGGKVPTVFVNGVPQKIGFRYYSPKNTVSFDDRLTYEDVVDVAVQYKKYKAQNNGWANQKFDSRIIVKKNNNIITDTDEEETVFSIDIAEFSNFEFPEFDETNSYPPGATKYKLEAENAISLVEETDGQNLFKLVANVYNSIERFFSQTFKELRIAQLPFTDAEQTQIDAGQEVSPRYVELPDINIDIGNGVEVNVATGVFTFTGLAFNKYDVITSDIIGSTLTNIGEFSHRDLEDKFELFNSGLPSSLSRVQQANIVKLGIFNEKKWPGEQLKCSEPFQAKYIVPRDNKFYDVLNSSVDYSLENSFNTVTFTLPYAATAVFVEETNRVMVGGRGGILGIDADNLDIDEYPIPEDGTPIIKKLHISNGVLYALTELNIFKSSNGGQTWEKLPRNGLPNKLFSIGIINNTIVIGAIDGVYFKSLIQDTWTKSLDSNSPVEVMLDPDLLFVLVDSQVYLTSNGSVFVKNGQIQKNSIYSLTKYQSLIFAATNKGLRKDDSTFYGGGAVLSLADVFEDISISESTIVNDVYGDGDKLVVGFSDGQYAILDESGFTLFSDEPLGTIQKVLIVNGGVWLFGFDLFTVPFLEHPIKLTTGVPI